jgi:hypothetical protein
MKIQTNGYEITYNKPKDYERAKKLKTLAQQANIHHHQVNKAWLGALDHAYQSGSLLIQAKKILKHGQWANWLERHFEGSYETAKVYIRIAKEWDNPRLVAARENEESLNSIKAVLKMLRNPKTKKLSPEHEMFEELDRIEDEEEVEEVRKEAQKKLKTKLSGMHPLEILILREIWDDCWGRFYAHLKKALRKRLKFNPYVHEIKDEEEKRQAQRKLKKLLKQCS